MTLLRSASLISLLTGICIAAGAAGSLADEPLAVIDTQQNAPRLSTPQEALAAIRVPEGFRVSLFAAEPDVRQPIAITTDPRGRLWVAENYTYAERPIVLDRRHRDQIVILEDADGDGRSDRRTVFWDQGKQLTSVEMGFGGVWAMCPPQLLFLPDRDGDDRPDGEAEVVLDGFDLGTASHHNFANGLKWGPDGWLYGRNGISNPGRVGIPGTRRDDRIEIGPGIWRFHPVTRQIEMVATGTTNPWGHDWDDHGELFFINTVIGHLWHAVPGAHFKRMFGTDSNPYVYELIDQTADHVHWDAAEPWQEAKKGISQSTDAAGGGHAHCGMMIYLGDHWPARYRGQVFTFNMHGRRINCDRLERGGASYVGRHEPDFLFSNDPWIRVTELAYGADGGVYIADWSDVGECHENDGVHRSSGRIFKVTYDHHREGVSPVRPAAAQQPRDLSKLNNKDLVALQLHPNDWFVRQSRQLLHERAASGQPMSQVHALLRQQYAEQPDVTRRLRALWTLYVTGGTSESWLLAQLNDTSEYIRAWAVRLLTDQSPPSTAALESMTRQARSDTSGLVLLYLASALQKLPAADRWPLAAAVASRGEFAPDRVLPLLLWYGVEPAVPRSAEQSVALVRSTQMPLVRRYVARRLTELLGSDAQAVNELVLALCDLPPAAQRDCLSGMHEALRGWHKATPPAGWSAVSAQLRGSGDEELQRLARELAVVFSDGRAIGELMTIAKSPKQDATARAAAIRSLVSARADGLLPLLKGLLNDRDVSADAVRGLAAFGDAETTSLLVASYGKLNAAAQEAAIGVLAARPSSAAALVEAIEAGQIDRGQVTVSQIRQMQTFAEPRLQALVGKLWPELRPVAEDKQARIAHLKEQLSVDVLRSADLAAGRQVFERSCAKCHTLFGEGGKIGPDLTGAQRTNLDYLLENIVDPSASLVPSFRMSIIELADGRVLSGVILTRTDQAWEVQTPQEKLVIRPDDVARSRESTSSLMPDGLLDVLANREICDLVAYLMSPRPIGRP